jgi:hypothetical protein
VAEKMGVRHTAAVEQEMSKPVRKELPLYKAVADQMGIQFLRHMPLCPLVAKQMKVCFGTAVTPFKTQESKLPLYPWVAQQMKSRFNEDHDFAIPQCGMPQTVVRSPRMEKPVCLWVAELMKIRFQGDDKKKKSIATLRFRRQDHAHSILGSHALASVRCQIDGHSIRRILLLEWWLVCKDDDDG